MAELDPGRRNFLTRLLAGLGVLAGLEAAWIAVSTIGSRRRNMMAGEAGVIEAGPAGRFAIRSVTPFPEAEFYLVRLEDGGFLALVGYGEGDLLVRDLASGTMLALGNHASAFDIRGAVLSSPAPRPLDLFAVAIKDGNVLVDTSRTLRRSAFEPEQVARIGAEG